MAYSKQIANMVVSYMEKNEWHYEFDDENGIINLNINFPGKLKKLNYMFSVYESDLAVYAAISLNVDEETRSEMAEFITRANYGMLLGNFEMDYRDGEIRFKLGIDCDEYIPSEKIIGNAISIAFSMYKRYGDGILAVMFGLKTAEEAINDIEG